MSFTDPSNRPQSVTPAVPVTSSTEAIDRLAAGLALAETKADLGNTKGADACLRVVREYRHLSTILARREDDDLRRFCTDLVAEIGEFGGDHTVSSIAEDVAAILGIEVPS